VLQVHINQRRNIDISTNHQLEEQKLVWVLICRVGEDSCVLMLIGQENMAAANLERYNPDVLAEFRTPLDVLSQGRQTD
jgi:hypothetical protein